MARRRALTLALACALAAAACGEGGYRGSWEVVGYRRPAVSIIGDLEAQTMLGATLELTRETATTGDQVCTIAEDQRQTLGVRSIEMAYDLARGELGLEEENVEMFSIECAEGGVEFGKELIRVGRDSLLTPWDGIFLLLEKRRS